MPFSNRSGFYKIVTALFAGGILCLIVTWIYQTGFSMGQSQREQERNSAQYAADAEHEIENRCLLLEPPAMAECIREVIEATNEHDRAENDLVAQTEMAWWAFWMAVISGAAVAVTALGVWYVAMTLREARWTTRAAIRSIVQAKRANDIARETAHKQLRAYLHTDQAFLSIEQKVARYDGSSVFNGKSYFPATLAISFKNAGQTPASEVSLLIFSANMIYPRIEDDGSKIVMAEWHLLQGMTTFHMNLGPAGEAGFDHEVKIPLETIPKLPVGSEITLEGTLAYTDYLGKRWTDPLNMTTGKFFFRTRPDAYKIEFKRAHGPYSHKE